jgi:SulP family sulfate permease
MARRAADPVTGRAMSSASAAQGAGPGHASAVELFTPKLITILREGYGIADVRADLMAGLTVAIVALPLSMAIAIASGVSPDRGLYTSIVGGFMVSLLGGSRFQIGGPAGAFIVLVAAAVAQHGVEGLVVATFMSGFILLAVGFLRLGTFIKYIPFPVTVGFTAGIAVIIFASQLKDLLGLRLQGQEPGPLLPKLDALDAVLPTISASAVALSALTIAIIVLLRRYKPQVPGMIVAVAVAAIVAAVLKLPAETIGTQFGGIPAHLPMPQIPALTPDKMLELLPTALSFALLGGIESLLSAVVADSMTGRRHRSNCELVAQGAANVASALFGGICVTGTIARTATNVRSGARGPVAGMLHALFLLLFMLIAAPLASFIPLAALAAVLAVVAWGMVEKHAFATLIRASRADAVVLLVTFLLVMFRDLTEGIIAGFVLAALLFLHRLAQSIEVRTHQPLIDQDVADDVRPGGRTPYDSGLATDRDVVVYRISGAFFFGAAASVATALDRAGAHPKVYVVDFSGVPILDSTGAVTMEGFVRKATRAGADVHIVAPDPIAQQLMIHGVRPPAVQFWPSLDAAVAAAHRGLASMQA